MELQKPPMGFRDHRADAPRFPWPCHTEVPDPNHNANSFKPRKVLVACPSGYAER